MLSRREAIDPSERAEWYFLISNASQAAIGTVNALNHKFTPVPFGNDLFAQFGDEAALPVVGNFDPPTSSAALITDVDHNPRNPMDVDNDGVVAAADVLAVINYINAGRGDQVAASSFATAPFVDVNGDRYVAADDVLHGGTAERRLVRPLRHGIPYPAGIALQCRPGTGVRPFC